METGKRGKLSVCMICDSCAYSWIPQLANEWSINYMFCQDNDLKKSLTESFNLHNVEMNETNDVFDYINNLDESKVDVIFLALFTNNFHEQVIEYIIKKRKIFYIFSSNLPTLNYEKLENLRNLTKNFNLSSEIVYDVKSDFKEKNKQFYYHIYNTLLTERVFTNLKEMLGELGNIYGVNIECTFIPFLIDDIQDEESEIEQVPQTDTIGDKEAVLFHRVILITSIINYLFQKPKAILANSYIVKRDYLLTSPYKNELPFRNIADIMKCISGYVALDNLHCNVNIAINTPNKIFHIEVYGENGYITLFHNSEHNCFQIQRCMNHYEYPQLYLENSQQNSLNELKYFVKEKYYTNKYINAYIDAIYIASCIWKSNGLNVSLSNLSNKKEEQATESNIQKNFITA